MVWKTGKPKAGLTGLGKSLAGRRRGPEAFKALRQNAVPRSFYRRRGDESLMSVYAIFLRPPVGNNFEFCVPWCTIFQYIRKL